MQLAKYVQFGVIGFALAAEYLAVNFHAPVPPDALEWCAAVHPHHCDVGCKPHAQDQEEQSGAADWRLVCGQHGPNQLDEHWRVRGTIAGWWINAALYRYMQLYTMQLCIIISLCSKGAYQPNNPQVYYDGAKVFSKLDSGQAPVARAIIETISGALRDGATQ